VRAQTSVRSSSSIPFIDYYRLLNVESHSSLEEIKTAYRFLQKRCHPDISGNELGHAMGILLNEAYSNLKDPQRRASHDAARRDWLEEEGFTGSPYSEWAGDAEQQEALFVDEGACIGCLKCALRASNTFAIEMRHGKARVLRQWGDPGECVEAAIEECPVSCIHRVDRAQLPALEHVMRREVARTHGRPRGDPFAAAARFMRRREESRRETPQQGRANGTGGWVSREAAASSIATRAAGGSASWWHAVRGGSRSGSCAIVRSEASAGDAWSPRAPDAVDLMALEYLLEAARARAQRRIAEAYSLGFDGSYRLPEDVEYWQRPEPVSHGGSGQTPGGRGAQRVRGSFVEDHSWMSSSSYRSQADQDRGARSTPRQMAVMALMACIVAWSLNFFQPGNTAPSGFAQPISAAECYRRGGGICRLFMQ